MPYPTRRHRDRPFSFSLRFQGVLDKSWFASVQNLTLATTSTGGVTETIVSGEAPDEAALIGLINLLYELGCPLISVESSEESTLRGALPP